MRYGPVVVALCAISVFAARSNGQTPVQPVFAACGTSGWGATERQVSVPAHLLTDTSSSKAASSEKRGGVLVQFVVDTLGVPDTATVHLLPQGGAELAERAKTVIGKWRYSPALATGCKVRQRVTVSSSVLGSPL